MQQILVTGFRPFDRFASNPSEHLAKGSGKNHEVLEVSYDAVDHFFKRLDPSTFQTLLMLGVHGTATALQLEMLAHNWIGSAQDVLGDAPTGPIHDGPPILAGTLWRELPIDPLFKTEPIKLSYHPGSYLCNYIYYRALFLYPDKRVGFLHLPSEAMLPLSLQAATLEKIVALASAPSRQLQTH
jgi:pyroglutamyl-peptidase